MLGRPFGHNTPPLQTGQTGQTDRQTDRQTGQRSDSVGRTVLQTVVQKPKVLQVRKVIETVVEIRLT